MSQAFSSYPLLSNDVRSGQETLVIPASSQIYTKPFSLTLWDSNDGIFATIAGNRYGTNDTDVTITLQQATLIDCPDDQWEDVGSAVELGSGGTVGSPTDFYVTISAIPQVVSGSMMPFVRMKFITAAASGANITKLYRTSKGR
jgi:hypothetical protein